MAPNDTAQIMSAIEGLHGDVLSVNTAIGELKGQFGVLEGKLGNGINIEIKDLKKWKDSRPLECPAKRNSGIFWKVAVFVSGLSGWGAFALFAIRNTA